LFLISFVIIIIIKLEIKKREKIVARISSPNWIISSLEQQHLVVTKPVTVKPYLKTNPPLPTLSLFPSQPPPVGCTCVPTVTRVFLLTKDRNGATTPAVTTTTITVTSTSTSLTAISSGAVVALTSTYMCLSLNYGLRLDSTVEIPRRTRLMLIWPESMNKRWKKESLLVNHVSLLQIWYVPFINLFFV